MERRHVQRPNRARLWPVVSPSGRGAATAVAAATTVTLQLMRRQEVKEMPLASKTGCTAGGAGERRRGQGEGRED